MDEKNPTQRAPTLPLPPPKAAVFSPTLPLPPPRSGGPIEEAAVQEALAYAQQLKQSPNFLSQPSEPIVHGQEVERSNVRRPSLEEIVANDQSILGLPPHLLGMENFLPDLRKKKPVEILQLLSERYRAQPSPQHAALLQHAINRITTCGPITGDLQDEIKKATEVFHRHPPRAATAADEIK
jgi:hypothetical protein